MRDTNRHSAEQHGLDSQQDRDRHGTNPHGADRYGLERCGGKLGGVEWRGVGL
ncbi:hypothetical protein Ssi03_04930 [Sphaerisporangium siamense]|nr:hypothetical protein Ssi03_04930 [Sphaerisporangium siamense]